MGIELEAYLTIPVFSSNSVEGKHTGIVSIQSTPTHTSRENRIHFKRLHRWGTPIRYYIKYKQIKTYLH